VDNDYILAKAQQFQDVLKPFIDRKLLTRYIHLGLLNITGKPIHMTVNTRLSN